MNSLHQKVPVKDMVHMIAVSTANRVKLVILL